jgi:hypothetical protein
MDLLAESFFSRFQRITKSLSLREAVSQAEVVDVLSRFSTLDDRLKGLLAIPALRAVGETQIMTKLHEALTGHRVVLDSQGDAAERLVSSGGIAFFCITTSTRKVQVGVPSESIKCFVKRGETVPVVYVLPPEEAPSYGDLEFPLFWNFFIQNVRLGRKDKVTVVGTSKQLERVKIVFRESMFGPEKVNLNDDIDPSAVAAGYSVDFAAESLALSPNLMHLEDFAMFVELDAQGRATLEDGIEIHMWHNALLEVFEPDGKLCASLDMTVLQEDTFGEEEWV